MTDQAVPILLALLMSNLPAARADPVRIDAEAAKRFAKALESELGLKATRSRVRRETRLAPTYDAVSATFAGLQVSRVWLDAHAKALEFANMRRIELTTDGKRSTLFKLLEVRGEQVLVASGRRLQDPGFLHRVRRAAWRLMDGAPRPQGPSLTLDIEFPTPPQGTRSLTLYRVRVYRRSEQFLLELPAAGGNRASVPGLPPGALSIELAVGASPDNLDWIGPDEVDLSAKKPVLTYRGARGSYAVLPQDTLTAIAARFSVPLGDLARTNGIRALDPIRVGQVLQIPRTPWTSRARKTTAAETTRPAKTSQQPRRGLVGTVTDPTARRAP